MPSDFSPFPFNMIGVAYLEDRLKMLLSLLNAQFVENYVSDYAAAYGNILLIFGSSPRLRPIFSVSCTDLDRVQAESRLVPNAWH